MKSDINLLPPNPQAQIAKERQGKIISFTSKLLLVFLVVNLIVFGLYFFIVKSTADTLTAVKSEEQRVVGMAAKEKLYRSLGAKLAFLSSTWQTRIKPDEVTSFSQGTVIEGVNLTKISLSGDGGTTLLLEAKDSDIMSRFLQGLTDQEKNGRIKSIKLSSVSKDPDKGYILKLIFIYIEKNER